MRSSERKRSRKRGVGSRVGAPIPKQFIEVLGKPVLYYTLEEFEKHEEVDAIKEEIVTKYEEENSELDSEELEFLKTKVKETFNSCYYC